MTVINTDELALAIRRRGSDMEPETFLAVLREMARSVDSLTTGEVDYLAEHAGVTPTDSETSAQVRLLLGAVRDEEEAANRSYTTAEAAAILRTASSNVRRMVNNREVITAGKRGATHLIPRWQLVEGHPLPHLAKVLAVISPRAHPLDVEMLMTTPAEELAGRTPIAWLVSGGDPEPVVWLADSWARA